VKPTLLVPGLFALLATALPAYAEDPAGAEALFREGRALFADGQVEAACLKFKASQALEASPGTLLNLAACHAAAGKTATAWAEFVAAGRLAHSEHKDRQETEAKRRAAELEATLSYLTVRVPVAVPGLEVRRAGELLEPSIYGMRVPVDPGMQTIEVSAPGYQMRHLEVRVPASKGDEVVDVPKLEPSPAPAMSAAPPPSAGTVSSGTGQTRPASRQPPVAAPGSSRTLPIVVGGIGGALLLTGAVAGTLALRSNSAAKELCPEPSHCNDSKARSLAERRNTEALIADVGVGVGLAGLGLATVLLLTSKSDETGPPAAHRVFPVVAPGHASLTWVERF
jgi:hypothetical protein